jgi:hypothetical protein
MDLVGRWAMGVLRREFVGELRQRQPALVGKIDCVT